MNKFAKNFRISQGSWKDLGSMIKRDVAGILAHTKGAGYLASAIGFVTTGAVGAFIDLKLKNQQQEQVGLLLNEN